ncbi:MAG: alkaline phosphatase family protein [Steroidobacteraceae bacterium]
MNGKVIVLEFNELSPVLMNRFIERGHLPNFQKLRDQSIVCISDAHEESPALEPWIQWISIHTGLTYAHHGVFHLGDGEKLKNKRTWDYLADNNRTAWVCGSMNAAVNTTNNANLFILPDPWSQEIKPHPLATFQSFFHFVRTYVQEYTREKVPLTKSDYARFAGFMVENGLSAGTVRAAVLQLLGERLGTRRRWGRAAIMDRLQWDVFGKFYRKLQPTLSTFFLNSTAHYQHYYWRNMEPELFALKDGLQEQAESADAILFGYRSMDRIIGECMKMAGPDVSIILATALSQQPMTRYEETGGKLVFRPTDISELMRLAGINSKYEFLPVMAEEFHLMFKTDKEAADACERLKALRVTDGRPVMSLELDGHKLFGGCAIIAEPGQDAFVVNLTSGSKKRFDELFYVVTGLKSGMHHPHGILWIRLPADVRRNEIVQRKVPIEEIGATILELCGISSHATGFPARPMPEVMALIQPEVLLKAAS